MTLYLKLRVEINFCSTFQMSGFLTVEAGGFAGGESVTVKRPWRNMTNHNYSHTHTHTLFLATSAERSQGLLLKVKI